MNTEQVKELARKLHEGHFRRDGVTPYFTHLERVASRVSGNSAHEEEIAKQIAYLHDSIEDGRTTRTTLMMLGVSPSVIQGVEVLTKDKYDDYLEYIKTLEYTHSYVRAVKIADILDNLSDSPSKKQIIKYAKALLILHEET
jgi:(p)ppGpp synthase/HD superfamily hydrolase